VVSWRELVAGATDELSRSGITEAEISARHIGQRATGTDGAEWLDVLDQPANQRQLAAFDAMVARRREGEPLQYVIGRWGFRHLDLFVDRRVLIPRPETEVVAGAALDEVCRLAQTSQPVVVADLGTGSGAIGLALAAEHQHTEVWLGDVSADALAVARANLAGIGRAGARVRVVEGDWFNALPPDLAGRLGVIVANPPYVAHGDEVDPQVRWEPAQALYAEDPAATAHIEVLIDHAPSWLMETGALVVEMAPHQVPAMVERAGPHFRTVEKVTDLSGRARAIVGRFPLPSAGIRSAGTT